MDEASAKHPGEDDVFPSFSLLPLCYIEAQTIVFAVRLCVCLRVWVCALVISIAIGLLSGCLSCSHGSRVVREGGERRIASDNGAARSNNSGRSHL